MWLGVRLVTRGNVLSLLVSSLGLTRNTLRPTAGLSAWSERQPLVQPLVSALGLIETAATPGLTVLEGASFLPSSRSWLTGWLPTIVPSWLGSLAG